MVIIDGPKKANFTTVEEENDFRRFVIKTNEKFANLINLDLTNEKNAKGVLNNPTIQKAWQELGRSYLDFQGREDEYFRKEKEYKEIKNKGTGNNVYTLINNQVSLPLIKNENFTDIPRNKRDVYDKFLGVSPEGEAVAYPMTVGKYSGKDLRDINKPFAINLLTGHPMYIESRDFVSIYKAAWGSNVDEVTEGNLGQLFAHEYVDYLTYSNKDQVANNFTYNTFKYNFIKSLNNGRFGQTVVQAKEHFDYTDYFTVENDGDAGMNKVKITRQLDGATLEFNTNNYENRAKIGIANNWERTDFPSTDQINRSVFLFVNGYSEDNFVGDNDNYGGKFTTVRFTPGVYSETFTDDAWEQNPLKLLYNTYTDNGTRIRNENQLYNFLYGDEKYKLKIKNLEKYKHNHTHVDAAGNALPTVTSEPPVLAIGDGDPEAIKQRTINTHEFNPLFQKIQDPAKNDKYFVDGEMKIKEHPDNAGFLYQDIIENAYYDNEEKDWFYTSPYNKETYRVSDYNLKGKETFVGSNVVNKYEKSSTINYPGNLIKGELKWSQQYPILKQINDTWGNGIFDYFVGGGANYWDSYVPIKNFFSLNEDDAAERLALILPNAYVTDNINWSPKSKHPDNLYFTIKYFSDMQDVIHISYRDENDEVKVHQLSLSIYDASDAAITDYNNDPIKMSELMNRSRDNFIKLVNFLEPQLKRMNEVKNSVFTTDQTKNINKLQEVVKEDYTLDASDNRDISKKVFNIYNQNEEFVDDQGSLNRNFDAYYDAKVLIGTEYEYIYDEAEKFANYIGYSSGFQDPTKSESYINILNTKAKDLLTREFSKDLLELKFKKNRGNVDRQQDLQRFTQTAKNYLAGVEQEFTEQALKVQVMYEEIYNHPYLELISNFQEVYSQEAGGNIKFAPSTNYAVHEYKVPSRKFSHLYTYGGDFYETKQIKYLDEIEIEIENGEKLKIDRSTYNNVVTAYSWLEKSLEDIKVIQEENMLELSSIFEKSDFDRIDDLWKISQLNYSAWEKFWTKIGYGTLDIFGKIMYGGHTFGSTLMGVEATPYMKDMMFDFQEQQQRSYNRFFKEDYELGVEYSINPFNKNFYTASTFGFLRDVSSEQIPIFAMYMSPFGIYTSGVHAFGSGQFEMDLIEKNTGKKFGFWERTFKAGAYAGVELGLGVLPTKFIAPKWLGGYGGSTYLFSKFIPKKYHFIYDNKNIIKNNSKYKGLFEISTKDYIKANIGMTVASPFIERYSEGGTQLFQNWILGRENIFEGVDKAMDAGFIMGNSLGTLSLTSGVVLNNLSDRSNLKLYQSKMLENDRIVQQINNLQLKSELITKRYVLNNKKPSFDLNNALEKTNQDIIGLKETSNDLKAEMRDIIALEEKKFFKLGNKFLNQYSKVFNELQSIKVKAKSVLDNKSISNEIKQIKLDQLKIKFDQNQVVLDIMRTPEAFGDNWRAFEKSQLKEDVERREEIIGKVTTELIEDGNANPTDQQINEAAEVEYYFQEIIKDSKNKKRTKLAKDFNTFEEVDDAIKGFTKLLNENKITESQYVKLVTDARSGKDLGATIEFVDKNGVRTGETFAYEIVRNAAKAGRTKTKTHEIGHQITIEAFGNNSEIEAQVADQLLKFVDDYNPSLGVLLRTRIERNTDGSIKTNEVIPNFLELVAEEKIDFNKRENMGLGSLIGDLFGKGISDATNTDFDFDFEGEQDAVNFFIGLGKKISKDRFTLKDMAAVKRNFLSKTALKQQTNKFKKQIQHSKDVAEENLNKYALGEDGTFNEELYKPNSPVIANELPGMIRAQINNYFNKRPALQVTEDGKQEMEADVMFRLYNVSKTGKSDVNSFDGRGDLYGYLNGRIKYRMLDHFKSPSSVVTNFSQKDINELQEGLLEDTQPDVQPSVSKQKVRTLKDLSDLDLDNISEIQAEVQAEVDALIEIDLDNSQKELDKLIKKEFRKLIIKDMGKISQKKGQLVISDQYSMFFAENYKDIVDALSVDVIKNNYNNLFEITEVSKEDVKKIDEKTGKTTNYRKGIFNIKGNKAIFTKYFTQGGYTTLKDRQSALATLIAESVAKTAVDNHILENSNNENAIIDAKLRKISENLDKNKNEFKTFDNIQYSRQVEAKNFLNNLRKEIELEVNRKKRNGKPFHQDKGRAAEQAINNILQKYEDTMPGFIVVVKKATEKDNMADLSIGFKIDEDVNFGKAGLEEFQLVNIEIKLDAQKIKLTSKSVTQYDFINDEVFIKNDNLQTINYTGAFDGSKKVFKQFYEKANELIEDINNGRFLDKDGNVVKAKTTIPLMKISNDFMPQIVYDRLKEGGYVKAIVEANIKKLNEDHVSEHHGNKKHPAAYIELIGNGLFSLGTDVFFNGKVPPLKMEVEGVFTVSKNSEQPSRAKATKGVKLRKKLYGLDMVTARPRFVSRPIEGSVGFSNYSLADQQSMTELSSMYTRESVNINKSTKSDLTISEALLRARPIINYSKESRGMSAFDFDETLIIEGENFIEAKNPETGEIVKISSGRWPLDGPSYANLGYTFDFKDFVNVRGGVDGPLLTKLRNRIEKYGAENNYILTARPAESATAIHGWLKTKGINIPLKNITGLGNSTGEAKAMWIAGKYSEGYNDIYFVDDALPNVEAVANVIDQLDIKGKSVQAKIQFSKDMSKEFNKIIQEVTGIPAVVKFSEVQAKLRGKGFKFNGIIPSSAQDFAGLLYNLIGKGKKGEKQFDFLKKALIDPFARGVDELNTVRQKASEDYKNILKQLPEVKSDLNSLLKTFEDIDIPKSINEFNVDQAVRVYIWNKAGFEIPGLSIRDQRALSNFVKSQEDLVYFAEVISKISKNQDGYAAPSEYWLTENIASDLMSDGAVGDVRAKFLADWIENKNQIFSKDNLNKLEAIYGLRYVEALKDVLYRMETGRQRPTGSNRLTNEFMNWTNGAIGSIMFFNIRSAVLQTISAVNYVNWSDNNPLLAAKAFANQPQYWKDFVMIFNSDFLKQRRAGNKRGVNEQELSQAVTGKGAYEQAKAVVRFLLKQGFLPTQIADSFAISAGGASFYRNRVNTYIKKGLSKSEAETKAFLDFQETTEVSQQSGRPDLISQQQASPLGRLILAFGNYPMQAGRIIDKAARDLINGRGDTKTNISKIIYYGFVANVLFQSLQSALFAVIGDEEEDELDKKKTRILNGMVDTWFQTFGVTGKAISTVKNTIMEFNKQRAKDLDEEFMTKSDHAYTLLQAISFSPPISSKLRKIYQSIQTERFNRDIMKERGLTLDNPAWSMFGNVIEGATNIPLGRISNKLLNLDNAMDAQHETWKRLALIMGWNTWDLGIQDPDLQALGEDIKERKKQEKEMEKVKIKQQKLREKYPGLDDEQIEIKLKSKEIMDLRKHEQIDLLRVLEVDEKEILKLKKEEQRSDKIAELYKDNEETIDKYLENSKNKSKEQIQKEVEEYKKSTRKKPKKSQGNTTREKALFKMKKVDQINILLELGYPNRDIKTLKYEKDRVAKIIELEKKSKNR
tara:strand:+ start:276 stop:10739 length:10464 start_codon:yes stop_codon:yes gene_type:complete